MIWNLRSPLKIVFYQTTTPCMTKCPKVVGNNCDPRQTLSTRRLLLWCPINLEGTRILLSWHHLNWNMCSSNAMSLINGQIFFKSQHLFFSYTVLQMLVKFTFKFYTLNPWINLQILLVMYAFELKAKTSYINAFFLSFFGMHLAFPLYIYISFNICSNGGNGLR